MTDCKRVMKIQLSVSEKYEVPLLLKEDDPKTNEEVLSLGSSMYEEKSRLLLITTDKSRTEQLEKNYESKLQQISQEHTREVARLRADNDDLRRNLQSLRDNLLSTTEQLVDRGYNKAAEYFDKLMKEKDERIHLLVKELGESKKTSSEIAECNKRLDKYLGGPVALGNFGEVKLDQFIRDKFTGCSVIDTSKEAAAGDMTVVLKSMRLLVESKNVATLTKPDVVKFEKDIGVMVSRKEINAALLVSYKNTNLYEGQKGFVFHYRHGIPVVYVGNAAENMELVRISIQMLISLVENGKTLSEDDTTDEKSEYLLAVIKDFYAEYQDFDAMLKEDRKIMLKMNKQVEKRQQALNRLTARFEEAVSKFPDIKDAEKVTSVGRPATSNKRKRDSDTIASLKPFFSGRPFQDPTA